MFWALVFLLSVGSVSVAYCAPNRVQTHVQPPAAVHGIVEGPGGLLYLSTGSGLFSYDGFRYNRLSSYPFSAVDSIAATADGWVWAWSQSEGIARYRLDSGFVVVWRGESYYLVAAGNFIFFRDTKRQESLRLDASGSLRSVGEVLGPIVVDVSRAGQLWRLRDRVLFRLDPSTLREERVAGVGGEFVAGVPDARQRIWTASSGGATAWSDGRVVAAIPMKMHPKSPGRFFSAADHLWFFGASQVVGLEPRLEYPISLQPGSVVMADSRASVWLASPEGPLQQLIADAAWEQWPLSDMGGATPVHLFRNQQRELILVTEKQMWRLDTASRSWKAFPAQMGPLAYVLPLAGGEYLASVRDYGLALVDARGALKQRIAGSEDLYVQDDFRELARAPDGHYLLGNKNAYFEMEGSTLRLPPLFGVQNHGRRVGDDFRPLPHVVDFERGPDGKMWMGYSGGLAWRDEKSAWNVLPTEPPLHTVRSFAFRSAREIWVAHRVPGHFSRVLDGKVTRFRVEEGYGPGQTHFLKVDRRGWIWRGTDQGVYVSNGVDIGPDDWLRLEASGESRQYGFFEDTDGSIWIAGLDGVTHVQPDASWFQPSTAHPLISRILVDGQVLPELPARFEKAVQIRIEFSRLNAPLLRAQPIRYRLSPISQDWRAARDGAVEWSALPAGRYKLEARMVGASKGIVKEFSIGPEPALQSSWLGAALVLFLLGGLGLFRFRELLAYRLSKAWFLLRRRWGRARTQFFEDDRSGEILAGRYRLSSLLSRGGFATVYKAIDQQSGGWTAVKVLGQRSGAAEWVRARYAQEITALHSVRHPGVIPILDSWILASGEPCLAMPLVEGPTLRQALDLAPWPMEQTCRFLRQLGDALVAVHAAGVVHRDLKPENILVQPDGSALLIDFGSSGLLGSDEEAALTKLLAGSWEYLAPERLTGHYSPASDIYSFGTVVFEILTRSKFAASGIAVGTGSTRRELAVKLGASANPRLAELLSSALHPLPEMRPTHAGAWADEVVACLPPDPERDDTELS
jgi:hypothetical protein